jgi:ribosomal protein L11 methyltransferase
MNKYYNELTVAVDDAYADLISDFIMSHADTGVEFAEGKLIVRSEEDLTSVKDALISLRNELGETIIGEIETERKANEDWVERYKASITPIEAGRFWVYPGWYEPKEDRINLRIDPALAFGSGHHATTYSCLAALDDLVKPQMRMLDVGCGSGILALAAAKLGAKVELCDTDPLAVDSAKENFARNEAHYERIWEGSANKAEGLYDIVTANIIADVLRMIAADLKKRLAPGGKLILSGILDKKESDVQEAFKDLTLINRIVKDEWVTLVYQKESHADQSQ